MRINSVVASWLLFLICFARATAAEPKSDVERNLGPWNSVARNLRYQTQFDMGPREPRLSREIYYRSVPYQGKPTRVFGYIAWPETPGSHPAMLCVHGGGGKAFREWAELWAKRGYVALAMDTAGNGPDGKHLPDGGPDQTDQGKFGEFTDETVVDMWTYHAVAAVLSGHGVLNAIPEVDRDRIGITGISWGGYLTCIAAGIDDDLKVAIPVYGCGYLDDDSAWLDRFAKMSPELKKRWLTNFDPSKYLAGASCPMLFVNGTNDFAYPLGSYKKSYELVTSPVTLCIRVRMPHGHSAGWAPEEIGLFADSILKQGKPLAKIGAMEVIEGTASAKYSSVVPIKDAQLHYAVATGPWQKRTWTSIAATYERGVVKGKVPHARPIVFYLTVTDERGALVSTPHAILEN